jgi:hypothetical protein
MVFLERYLSPQYRAYMSNNISACGPQKKLTAATSGPWARIWTTLIIINLKLDIEALH